MSKFDYDLFVIGGGSGGVRAARVAGELGKKVALAEEYRMGGTCVVRGCVPKKLYVYASHYSEMFEDAKGFGWRVSDPEFDWHKLVEAKEKEIKRLEQIYSAGLTRAQVEIFNDRAVFVDNHTIELKNSGKKITAEKILIATGSRPLTDLPIEGLEHGITTNELFDMPTLPKSMVIAGGGYTAVEFANIFHGLGVYVTLVHWKDYILSSFDFDLREGLQNAMVSKGLNLATEVTMKKIEKSGAGYKVTLSDDKEIDTDVVVVALGRRPYTQGLGLENTDVTVNDNGLICVDKYMNTTAKNIWALGDVANEYQLTPVAIHEAMCFIQTAFHDNPTKPDYEYIATAVFSQPELGKVGLSESEAVECFHEVEIYKTSFRPMVHTLSGRDTKVFIKLVVDAHSRKLVGAHMLGDNAGEIIQLLSIALKAGVTKEEFDATMAVHPTVSEEIVTMYKPNYRYVEGQKIVSC